MRNLNLFLSAFSLLVAMPHASAGFLRTSAVAYDTTRLQSYTDYLREGLAPPNYQRPHGTAYWDYVMRYPREAILSNAWCWSGSTVHGWCRTDLNFTDTTIALDENTFFHRDSLIKAYPNKTPYFVFEEHFNQKLEDLLNRRAYAIESMELTRYDRTDRSAGALVGGFSLLPSFLLAALIEAGLSGNMKEPYDWGRVGLMTAGFIFSVGITYAITMDPRPRIHVTHIRFSSETPSIKHPPRTPPVPEELEQP